MGKDTVSTKVFEALQSTDSPTLSNAIERLNVRDLITGFAGPRVRCMFPDFETTLGYAVTAQVDSTSPGSRAIGAGFRQLAELVEASPKPVVLVYQDIGPRPAGAAIFGEFSAALMKRLGTIALVSDGAVRDVKEVMKLGFQYFASSIVVSHGNPRILRIDVPVVVDGLYVEPGDLIHGDINGVLSVPVEIAHQLPEQVEQVRRLEREAFEFMKGPDFTLDAALKRLGH
ncbi:MAG: RraA family protein [Acidobacteria bacterium]|nr:RraA family protein [Acidobacteriota bacterium]